MSYFAKALNKSTPLPLEICEYILSFTNAVVPVVRGKDETPVSLFCYTVKYKRLNEIKNFSELDICGKCQQWRKDCMCTEEFKSTWYLTLK